MSENLIDIEKRWIALGLPRAERASVTLGAWTTDEEIAAMAADRAHVYGDRHVTDTEIRLFRSRLRTAAMATAAAAAGNRVLIQSVLDSGVAELVTVDATDEELSTIVTAAEAGHGAAIPGLRRELELLRAAELDDSATTPLLAAHVRQAEELVKRGVTHLPVARVAEVLAMGGRGVSRNGIAKALPVNKRTVSKILAARPTDQTPE